MERHDGAAGSAPLIFRERLVLLLEQGRRVPLTLMLAPPGAGKTTALRQWLEGPGDVRKIYHPVPRRICRSSPRTRPWAGATTSHGASSAACSKRWSDRSRAWPLAE